MIKLQITLNHTTIQKATMQTHAMNAKLFDHALLLLPSEYFMRTYSFCPKIIVCILLKSIKSEFFSSVFLSLNYDRSVDQLHQI